MDRRAFIGSVAGGLLAMPVDTFAQQQGKVWRIGFFYWGSRQSALDTGRYNAFVQGMRELGYVEGKNLVIEARFADGKVERLPDLATELVRLKVDVIVASGNEVYDMLLHSVTTIPTVIAVSSDPVAEGFATSLAQPGGNFTGITSDASHLGSKRLEFLKAVVPHLSRVGVLMETNNGSNSLRMKSLTLDAQRVGVQVLSAQAGTAAEIESGFDLLARSRVDAVIVLNDVFFVQQFQQIAQIALKQRVPSIAWLHEYAQAGGLMSYGAELVDNYRRAATYVDKILKGAKPGELPFEQPARYTLVINLKTAQALALTIPQSLLLRADEVIQ